MSPCHQCRLRLQWVTCCLTSGFIVPFSADAQGWGWLSTRGSSSARSGAEPPWHCRGSSLAPSSHTSWRAWVLAVEQQAGQSREPSRPVLVSHAAPAAHRWEECPGPARSGLSNFPAPSRLNCQWCWDLPKFWQPCRDMWWSPVLFCKSQPVWAAVGGTIDFGME